MAFKMKGFSYPGKSPVKFGAGIVKKIRKMGYEANRAAGEEMPTMTLEEMRQHDPERAEKLMKSGQVGTTFSPTKQIKKGSYKNTQEDFDKENPYWYKINGKRVSKYAYNKYKNVPGQMEGGGKTTNDPDPSGRKAQTAKDRAKLPKKHTVLTEQQTKNIK